MAESVHPSMFSSIPGPYLLDSSRISHILNCDNQKYLQILPNVSWRTKLSLIQNHWAPEWQDNWHFRIVQLCLYWVGQKGRLGFSIISYKNLNKLFGQPNRMKRETSRTRAWENVSEAGHGNIVIVRPPIKYISLSPWPCIISSSNDLGLGHVTSFDQWNINKHDTSWGLKSSCALGLNPLKTLPPCDKAGASLLQTYVQLTASTNFRHMNEALEDHAVMVNLPGLHDSRQANRKATCTGALLKVRAIKLGTNKMVDILNH